MSDRLYANLLDDAQIFIGMANRNLDQVKDIMFKLEDCQSALEELPASLSPTPKPKGDER